MNKKKEPMLLALVVVMQSNDRLYFQRLFLKNGDFYIKQQYIENDKMNLYLFPFG